MASARDAHHSGPDPSDATPPESTTPEEGSSSGAKHSRKRTKTGCLTCRKRRIKCGEERPVCKNCIKSRRHCEGYNPRVAYRTPAFDYRPVPNGAHIVFDARPPGLSEDYLHTLGFVQSSGEASGYADLGPRPLEFVGPSQSDGGSSQYVAEPEQMNPGFGMSFATNVLYHQRAASAGYPSGFKPLEMGLEYPGSSSAFAPMPSTGQAPSQMHPVYQDGRLSDPVAPNAEWVSTHQPSVEGSWSLASSMSQPDSPDPSKGSKAPILVQHSAPPISTAPWQGGTWTSENDWFRPVDYIQLPTAPVQSQYYHSESLGPSSQDQTHDYSSPPYHQDSQRGPLGSGNVTDAQESAVESQGDDCYEMEPDEEMGLDIFDTTSSGLKQQRGFPRIAQINGLEFGDAQVMFELRAALDHYRVEEEANPSKNPITARIFAYFVAVTGPGLSVCETRPSSTSVLLTEGQTPLVQRGLWTYTIPMAALRHQGLLHAMLALSCLQISRLYGSTIHPSMQHYACALTRIHSSVGRLTQSKTKLSTIAATMLLGHYEITAADHRKWHTHLTGAKQLFSGTDFPAIIQQFRQIKTDGQFRYSQNIRGKSNFDSQSALFDGIPDIDEEIVGQLAGRNAQYGGYDQADVSNMTVHPQLDLQHFEVLKDLYWLYLKQDAYQSVISGNPLLLDYDLWLNCPPRAPLGKADAPYGSFDHLILLLGRVADFAARDRRRKVQVMQTNGGQWQSFPRPSGSQQLRQEMSTSVTAGVEFQPRASGDLAAPQQFTSSASRGQPAFGYHQFSEQNLEFPSTFRLASATSTPQSAIVPDPMDLMGATQAALEEYGRIRAALHIFAQSLGTAFQPLSPEHQAPVDTPFGKALFYRSYDIGCLWAVYNMAVIVAIRAHPHMHPAAQIAANFSAQETSHFANEIGRIVAGILPPPLDQQLSPSLGAALSESCVPAFLAAVQYRDPAQRHATISRIMNIGVRTGWGSAEVIANGCETAWVKAAAGGCGPPYQRLFRREKSEDPRLNGSWERLDARISPDEKDDTDRRHVLRSPAARLHWAIGVLGTEADEVLWQGP